MSKKQSKSFTNLLLSAGLLSLIGTIFGLFYNGYHDRQIEKERFQNELTKEMLNIANVEERAAYASLLFSTGLLDEDQVCKDTLLYHINYQRGRQDAVSSLSILGAIELFYRAENRVPYNLDELESSLAVKTALKHFKEKIHYKASKADQFDLRFPGSDGHLYTRDDRTYKYEDLQL